MAVQSQHSSFVGSLALAKRGRLGSTESTDLEVGTHYIVFVRSHDMDMTTNISRTTISSMLSHDRLVMNLSYCTVSIASLCTSYTLHHASLPFMHKIIVNFSLPSILISSRVLTTRMPPPQIPLTALSEPESNSNSNTSDQTNAQERRPPLVMIAHSLPLVDPIHSPKEDGHAVEERHDGNDGESNGGAHGDVIAEVEERCCDGPEDDGEFELGIRVSVAINDQ